jgi:hypothetical protein
VEYYKDGTNWSVIRATNTVLCLASSFSQKENILSNVKLIIRRPYCSKIPFLVIDFHFTQVART